jgi:transcriptional regulator with XRE-family HTH domain
MSETTTSRSMPKGRPDEAHEMLGRQMRYLREARRVSPAVAGRHIGTTASKISRIERGRVKIKEDDLLGLLDLYGVPGQAELQAMLEFACRLNSRQWWQKDGTELDGWFCSYLVLESIAEYIRTYEVRFIPGLLQTPAYAEAVIRRRYTNEDEIRRRVDVRMRRQRMVLEAKTPRLWALVDKAALEEDWAGEHVMREQIEFLLRTAEQRSAVIQVLPSGAGGRAGIGNSFSLLRLRVQNLSDVVYLEHIDSALFLESPGKSDPYRSAIELLSIEAGEPEDTTSQLEKALANFKRA